LGTADRVVTGLYCSSSACQAAFVASAVASGQAATNQTTIQANCAGHLATLQAWLAANPNGAVLTAAQAKVLANMLVGIYKLLQQDFASTTGT
jgi:hypothetical protein